jgi:hypothetical protein
MGYDTAIYTDVSRDEAVDGVDGFNFQAVSAGIDGADLRHIRELLLHQISNRWPADRDDQEHPPTAAYLRQDGRSYFSRGISTGTTSNGRRGNQLTQAAVTRDDSDLHPYRPAQIYAATKWSMKKNADKECEPWFAPLEIHPDFEAEALLDWARTDPQVVRILPTYLSMLEKASEPQARKVVIVHDDLDLVMRWFALGTLLLDSTVARDLEYRAFAIDPFQTRAQLVGVSPQLQQSTITGAHIVDLAGGTTSAFEISESARRVVEWIHRLDSFDALDVIGIARRWMPVIGVPTGAAGAEMVTGTRVAALGREEWDLGIAVIEGLAANGLRDDLELYLDELGASVASYRLRGANDFERSARSARFASGTGISGLTQAILEPALQSLVEEPLSATAWARELNTDRSWSWPTENPTLISELFTEIIRKAPEEALSDLLGLAQGCAKELSVRQLTDPLRRATALVFREPHRYLAVLPSWYGHSIVRANLRSQVLGQIESAALRGDTLASLSRGTWDFLEPVGQLSPTPEAEAFKAWLTAAALSRVPPAARAEQIMAAQGLRQNTAPLSLIGATLPADSAVYIAWITRVGSDSELSGQIRGLLNPVLAEDPKTAKVKMVERWIPLAEALVHADPREPEFAIWLDELKGLIDKIPSLTDRMKAVGKVMKMGRGD